MDHIQYQIFKIILNIFKKKRSESVDNPSIRIYINKTKNRITFKIKSGYYLELLTPETMKLLGSTENKIKIKTGKDFATIAGKKIVHKSAEATGDLIGNEIADKITAKPSKKSHNEEIQSNEVNNEIPKERYISPKERQKIIDELRLT